MAATRLIRGCPAGWNFRSGAMAMVPARLRTQRSPSPRCSPRREVLAGGGPSHRPPFFREFIPRFSSEAPFVCNNQMRDAPPIGSSLSPARLLRKYCFLNILQSTTPRILRPVTAAQDADYAPKLLPSIVFTNRSILTTVSKMNRASFDSTRELSCAKDSLFRIAL